MPPRRQREYLRLLDSAKAAAETGIDAFNSVWHPYRNQTTLILIANSWELLAKATLLHRGESIKRGQRGETISAEIAIHRLLQAKALNQDEVDTLQQVISLRNAACHDVLPEVPPEVMQHLLFYSCKFFRGLVAKSFKGHLKGMSDSYLSLSFNDVTTYADKVQKAVSRIKKNAADRRLVWLLERGISFDGSTYLSEAQFKKKYQGKRKILPHLGLNSFLKRADMVRVVPIEAPRNFTADLVLRKGSAKDSALPVIIKKTELESDYPYLTKELGQQIGKNQSWTAVAIGAIGLKGDAKYHQKVRSSATSVVHRYSTAALEALKQKLAADPQFNPYLPVA